jgi:hypothetical protein
MLDDQPLFAFKQHSIYCMQPRLSYGSRSNRQGKAAGSSVENSMIFGQEVIPVAVLQQLDNDFFPLKGIY